jgi:hypothetical protein
MSDYTALENVRQFLLSTPDQAATADRLGRLIQQDTHLRGEYAQEVADRLVYLRAHPEELAHTRALLID